MTREQNKTKLDDIATRFNIILNTLRAESRFDFTSLPTEFGMAFVAAIESRAHDRRYRELPLGMAVTLILHELADSELAPSIVGAAAGVAVTSKLRNLLRSF